MDSIGPMGPICPMGPTGSKLLSLRELEPLSRSLLSVLLTFLLSRIACNQSSLLQSRAKVRVEFHQRTRDPVTNRTGLSCRSAAVDIHKDVELAGCIGQAKRLTDDHPQGFVRKVRIESAAIDRDLARTGTQVNACCRGFSAAGAVILNICHINFGFWISDFGFADLR